MNARVPKSAYAKIIAASAMIDFARALPGSGRRIATKCFCTGDIGQPLLMERAE
jgi:hypothetical protein